MPTLLATSPLAATRSKPVITASTAPVRMSAGRGGVDRQLVLDPEPAELPHRQPRALQQRARLAGEHAQRPPVGELGDHARARCRGRSRPAPRCCSGVITRPRGHAVLEQVGAVPRQRGARRLVLAVDRLGLGARRLGAAAARGRAHPLDRPGEVARGRARAGEAVGGRVERARGRRRRPSRGRRRRPPRSAARRGRRAARSPPPCPRPRSAPAPPRGRAAASGRARAGARPSQRRGGGAWVVGAIRHDGMPRAPRALRLRPRQDLRLGPRARRRRPRGGRGRARRPAGAERRRQVDARQGRVRPRDADGRSRRGLRRARRLGRGAPVAGLPGRALPLPRLVHGPRAARRSTSAWRSPRAARASGRSCSSSSGSPRRARPGWGRCPRACSSGSGSRRR